MPNELSASSIGDNSYIPEVQPLPAASSPFLANIDDVESVDGEDFCRQSPRGITGRVISWFYPSAAPESIAMTPRQPVSLQQEEASQQRTQSQCRPMLKKGAILLGAFAAGALLGAYGYSRYAGAPPGTGVAPVQPEPPQADPLIGGSNLFPRRNKEYSGGSNSQAPDDGRTIPNTTPSVVQELTPDDVKIEKMYDFSCLDVRNNMKFTDVLRTIGRTFDQPVDAIAKESQVIHFMNTKKAGCPDPESVAELEKYTKPIDSIINLAVGMIPGMQPVAILKLLVGPSMQMAADDLEGKPVDIEVRKNIFMQLLGMSRQTIPTLTADEMAVMQKPGPPQPIDIVRKRFEITNSKLRATVDGKSYELHTTAKEDLPYIKDNDENAFFIRWNQHDDKWETINNEAYSDDEKYIEGINNDLENLKKYAVDLKKQTGEWKITPLHDGGDYGFFSLSIAGKPARRGVFVRDRFVRAHKINVGRRKVTVTPLHMRQRAVLEDTLYGWRFEKKSAPIDKYLRMVLKDGIVFDYKNKFTQIADDGLSRDAQGNKYIKMDNLYYKVQPTKGGYKLPGKPDSLVTKENGVFTLKRDNSALFGYEKITITNGKTALEKKALSYLNTYAKEVTKSAYSKTLQDGIYENASGETVFEVNGRNFIVNKYTDEYIDVARNDDPQKSIRLIKMGNTYIRVRDTIAEKFAYATLSHCITKRSPGASACSVPIMLEKSIDKKLQEFVNAGKNSRNMRDTNLIEDRLYEGSLIYRDDFSTKRYNLDASLQLTYQTETQYFFLYKGNFFHTDIVEASDKSNPTGVRAFRLYGKGNLLTKREYIDTVIIDNQGDKIQVKPQSVYLAEKGKIPEEMAREYLKGSEYTFLGGIDEIEDAVNNAVAGGRYYVGKVPVLNENTPDIAESAINLKIKEMYPDRLINSGKYTIKTIKLTDDISGLTYHQQGAVMHIRNLVKIIKNYILPVVHDPSSFHAESESWLACRYYLSELLGHPPSDKFIDDVEAYIRRMARKMGNNIDYDKIFLTAIEPESGHIDQPEFSGTSGKWLSDEEKSSGKVAFAVPDKSKRMYICLDKTYAPEGDSFTPKADITSVILHELSHMDDMTIDSVYLPREENGMYVPAKQAVDSFINRIYESKLESPDAFISRSVDYLKNIPVYRSKIKKFRDPWKNHLAVVAAHDPGFRAHTLLNCADSASMIILDMYEAATVGVDELRYQGNPGRVQSGIAVAHDKYGTYFDKGGNYLIKEYGATLRLPVSATLASGKQKLMTRTDMAINNAMCLSRLYGDRAAAVLVNNAGYEPSVRFKKIPGDPLATVVDKIKLSVDATLKEKVNAVINGEANPADELTEWLVNKRIIVHDTQPGNMLFHHEWGFSFLSYDTADIWPEKARIPQSEIDAMRQRIRSTVDGFAGDCGLR